jgi:hypothetical protein
VSDRIARRVHLLAALWYAANAVAAECAAALLDHPPSATPVWFLMQLGWVHCARVLYEHVGRGVAGVGPSDSER